MTTPWCKLPLVLHLLVETPAALSFILHPTAQLPGCAAEAKLILRSYGGLLLATNLICLGSLARPGVDSTVGLIALCMGTYHLWPTYRAYARMKFGIGMKGVQGAVLGGPSLHFALHVFCFVSLMGTWWFGSR
ncbi:hypothetical protein B0T25DRAFT_549222 [Lasiosphaeria hispida]|uniref:Uncharacterized protein n=1 Tax=Lasiosphaeria hispida TaxID=260671 RepID=A0AAJ0HFJ7_9PEZI|nr:hypothetical protein B0T25DRAFT_549222 [Lasiosphaeria hispida]